MARPHPHGDHDRQAVPVHAAEPAGEHPAQQRAHRGSGDEQAGGPGVAAVPEQRDGRVQRPRIREDHRAHVREEGHPEVGPPGQEPQAVHHGGPLAPLTLRPVRQHRRQPPHRVQSRREGDRVDQVRRLVAPQADHDSAQHGADEGAGRGRHGTERVRRRQVFRRQQARDHRRARRGVERPAHRLEGHDRVEQPHPVIAGERRDGQCHGQRARAGRAVQAELAPVHRVRDGTPVEAEDDQRDQREQADEAHGEAGACDVVHLEGHRERGHRLARPGHRVADPQASVVDGDTQRGEIGENPAATTRREVLHRCGGGYRGGLGSVCLVWRGGGAGHTGC